MEKLDHTSSLKLKEFIKSPREKSCSKPADPTHLSSFLLIFSYFIYKIVTCKNVKLDPGPHPSLPDIRLHQDSFESKSRKYNFKSGQQSTKNAGIQPPSRFFLPLAVLPTPKLNVTGENSPDLLLPDSYRALGSFKAPRKAKINAAKGTSNTNPAENFKPQGRAPLNIGHLFRNISKIGNLARESSLKSKLMEAKYQEKDIGKNIQKFLMIKSKNGPKISNSIIEDDGREQRFDKETQGTKLLKDFKFGTSDLERKYESPVIHEMKRRRFVKEIPADQELDETIKEAEISVSSQISAKNYRGRDKHSFSFSESNENKSTSVDCTKSSNAKGLSFRSSLEKSMGFSRSLEPGYRSIKIEPVKAEMVSEGDKNTNEIKPIHEEAAEQRNSPRDQPVPRKENVILMLLTIL